MTIPVQPSSAACQRSVGCERKRDASKIAGTAFIVAIGSLRREDHSEMAEREMDEMPGRHARPRARRSHSPCQRDAQRDEDPWRRDRHHSRRDPTDQVGDAVAMDARTTRHGRIEAPGRLTSGVPLLSLKALLPLSTRCQVSRQQCSPRRARPRRERRVDGPPRPSPSLAEPTGQLGKDRSPATGPGPIRLVEWVPAAPDPGERLWMTTRPALASAHLRLPRNRQRNRDRGRRLRRSGSRTCASRT